MIAIWAFLAQSPSRDLAILYLQAFKAWPDLRIQVQTYSWAVGNAISSSRRGPPEGNWFPRGKRVASHCLWWPVLASRTLISFFFSLPVTKSCPQATQRRLHKMCTRGRQRGYLGGCPAFLGYLPSNSSLFCLAFFLSELRYPDFSMTIANF